MNYVRQNKNVEPWNGNDHVQYLSITVDVEGHVNLLHTKTDL